MPVRQPSHRFHHRQSSKQWFEVLDGTPALFLFAVAMAIGRYAAMPPKSGIVRVAKLTDDSQYRVQDEAWQVLLDQIVLSLIAFLCESLDDATICRSISLTV